MTTILNGVDDIRSNVGEHLGYSDYVTITQDDIDAFADLSGDPQWIHVDRDRASAGPFGSTIAHGMLTLAKSPALANTVFKVEGMAMGVNYGYQKIRYPSPVPVDSRVRVGVRLADCLDVGEWIQLTIEFTIEVEGRDRPGCVAEMLVRYIPEANPPVTNATWKGIEP
jgi:acyl dehydratase